MKNTLIISSMDKQSSCYHKAREIDQRFNGNGVIDGEEVLIFNTAIIEACYYKNSFCPPNTNYSYYDKDEYGKKNIIEGSMHVSEADIDEYLIPNEKNEEILLQVKANSKKIKSEGGAACVMAGAAFLTVGTFFSFAIPAIGIPIGLVGGGLLGLAKYLNVKNRKEVEQQLQENIENCQAQEMKRKEELEALTSSNLLGENIGKSVSEMLVNEGFSDIEVANMSDGSNQIFMKYQNKDIEVKFNKTSEDTFVGMLSTEEGDSNELYIFKAEYIETNKSKKLKVSKMRVVQDGLEDDADVNKKKLKETVTEENSSSSHAERNRTVGVALGVINIKDTKHSTDYTKIDKIVTEQLPEGKEITVYTVNK